MVYCCFNHISKFFFGARTVFCFIVSNLKWWHSVQWSLCQGNNEKWAKFSFCYIKVSFCYYVFENEQVFVTHIMMFGMLHHNKCYVWILTHFYIQMEEKFFYFISITKEWNNGIQRGNKCIMHTFQTLWVIFFFLHNKRVRSFDYYIYFLCIRNLFLRYSIKKFIHLNSMFVLRITSMYSILSNFCLNIFSFFLRSSLAIVDLITVLLFESFVRNGTQRSKKLC